MRVATYARYSSDQQRAASIADQQRLMREHCAREGWTVVAEFTDAAISGATEHRPGFQALQRAVRDGRCDLVLAEALDRLSRNQGDTAKLLERFTFCDVAIVTLAEGTITELHVGLKGTMNAIWLRDNADKTRRGLRGRVEAGQSGGGRCYGYRLVDGQVGARQVDPVEAAVVRRIFDAFVAGVAPKTIARTLNAERVPGPRGAAWSPSTIHGHVGRGTGILNNELYIGRLVWNRLRYVKDPDTGKRLGRPNPRARWIVVDVPSLRIVDEAVWQAAKARQEATRRAIATRGITTARRPRYLFSGLTVCGTCGGGFILGSKDGLICFNARERGTCTNRRRMNRLELERRVLAAMRTHLFSRERFDDFCRAYTDELTRLRREQLAGQADHRRELAAVDRRIRQIVQAIADGYRSDAIRDELHTLEARKAQLRSVLTVPPLPALHPKMADVYREKVLALASGLEHDADRDHARQALRGFIERIVIPPAGLLQVVGNLGLMLAAAAGRPPSVNDACGIGGCGGALPSLPHAVAVSFAA